jgi:uncharacterized protein (TIRG00374 family)
VAKETPKRKNLWRSIFLAVGFSALAISLLLYFTHTDLKSVFSLLNLWFFLGALGLILLNWLVEALRLCSISSLLGYRLPFGKALQIVLVGSFFANITPFDTGGEPFQLYLLAKNGVGTGKSAAIIMIKGIMSALARITLGIGIPLWLLLIKRAWQLPSGLNTALNIGVMIYVVVTILMLLVSWKPGFLNRFTNWLFSRKLIQKVFSPKKLQILAEKITHGVNEFRESMHSLAQADKGTIMLIAFYSLLLWIIVLTVPAFLLWGLGVNSPLPQILAVGIVFYLASAYAPTPGSSGVAEAGFATIFFAAQLVPYPLLGVFVTLWRLLTYYTSFLVGGLVSLFSLSRKKS